MLWMWMRVALAGPADAVAPDALETSKRPVIIESRTVIDFDEVDVRGLPDKPGVAEVFERVGTAFPPLFRLRESFDDRMAESVAAVQ